MKPLYRRGLTISGNNLPPKAFSLVYTVDMCIEVGPLLGNQPSDKAI